MLGYWKRYLNNNFTSSLKGGSQNWLAWLCPSFHETVDTLWPSGFVFKGFPKQIIKDRGDGIARRVVFFFFVVFFHNSGKSTKIRKVERGDSLSDKSIQQRTRQSWKAYRRIFNFPSSLKILSNEKKVSFKIKWLHFQKRGRVLFLTIFVFEVFCSMY